TADGPPARPGRYRETVPANTGSKLGYGSIARCCTTRSGLLPCRIKTANTTRKDSGRHCKSHSVDTAERCFGWYPDRAATNRSPLTKGQRLYKRLQTRL